MEQIEDTSLIVVSNYDNDSPQNYALGLIAGHAYSVEDFEGTYFSKTPLGPRVLDGIRTVHFSLDRK